MVVKKEEKVVGEEDGDGREKDVGNSQAANRVRKDGAAPQRRVAGAAAGRNPVAGMAVATETGTLPDSHMQPFVRLERMSKKDESRYNKNNSDYVSPKYGTNSTDAYEWIHLQVDGNNLISLDDSIRGEGRVTLHGSAASGGESVTPFDARATRIPSADEREEPASFSREDLPDDTFKRWSLLERDARGNFACFLCSYKHKRHDKIRRHLFKHFGGEFRCEACGRVFSKVENMRKHALVHSGPEADSFRCSQCPFVFTTQWQVRECIIY